MKLKFADRVYKLTAQIPKGKVATYQSIAIAMGQAKASRAVGNALNKNPYAPQVPCHRVVRSNGEIGGFASGSNKKIKILKSEGIIIINNKVDLSQHGYQFKAKR